MQNKYIILWIIVVLIVLYLIYRYYKSTKKIKSILFIGDSNTVFDFSYADQLKKLYPSIRIKKIAKNGATTDWMLEQLKNELNTTKYDAVSILGGSNDIYNGVDLNITKYNLDAMYSLAKSKGMKVIAITPPNKNFFKNRTEQKQNSLIDLVNWIGSNNKKDYFINFWDITNNQSFFISSDGYLHPQENAHKIVADSLYKKIK